jgi:hypothetical protein
MCPDPSDTMKRARFAPLDLCVLVSLLLLQFIHFKRGLEFPDEVPRFAISEKAIKPAISAASAALRNFERSAGRYLLTTTFIERDDNSDVTTGGWRPLNLERPPFCFPPPVAVVDERCLHSGGSGRDKRLGLWEIASLPPSPPGG